MNKEFIRWYHSQQQTYIPKEQIENLFKEQVETLVLDLAPFFDYNEKRGISLNPKYALGILQIKKTIAFLLQKDTADLVVELENIGNALDQDLVIVEKQRRFNVVRAVIHSHLTQIIASVRKTKKSIRFESPQTEGRFLNVNHVPDYIVDGHVVLLQIDEIGMYQIQTTFLEVIGHKNDPDMDIVKIIYEYQWPLKFNKDVLQQVFEMKVDHEYEAQTRVDLTKELVVTIDGADAKDLDDAISFKQLDDDTYELGVHIADVSYFVREHTPLDMEAYARATSVYLADRVIPMLPHGLSNDLCSLNPHEKKYTISCVMIVNGALDILSYKIIPTIIESKYRLTYDAVNQLLKKHESLGNEQLDDMLFKMNEFAQVLKIKRRKRGAIDFESSELKFDLDVEGHVLGVKERHTDDAEMLIESFMILANETVATHLYKHHLPCIYRVHEKPDVEKLDQALYTLERLGFKHDPKSKTTAKMLQKLTDETRGTPYEYIVHSILLRSMQKAKYAPDPIGHFGLGSEFYSHFTSPIRRYPDLLLHRMIRAFEFDKKENLGKKKAYFDSILPTYSEHTSAQERKAIQMERDVVKLKSCEYLQDRIGEVFDATIIQMMPSGFFVKLMMGIEGFVSLRNLPMYLVYDEENLLFYTNYGKRYKLGDKISVKLIKVDMTEMQIDFVIETKDEDNNSKKKSRQKVNKTKRSKAHQSLKRRFH